MQKFLARVRGGRLRNAQPPGVGEVSAGPRPQRWNKGTASSGYAGRISAWVSGPSASCRGENSQAWGPAKELPSASSVDLNTSQEVLRCPFEAA